MSKREPVVQDIRRSSERIGTLYPVLIAKNGEVIDGKHRLAADSNWPTLRLDHIESEKDKLLAKLISNICRRTVQPHEKTQMLDDLAALYLKEGEEHRKLVYRIVEDTGMSYRWVMKYLPNRMKQRKHIGGTHQRRLPATYRDNSEVCRIARRAIVDFDKLVTEPHQRYVAVKNYANTSFVTFTVDRPFYEKLERLCMTMSISLETVINNALMLVYREMETLAGSIMPKVELAQKGSA